MAERIASNRSVAAAWFGFPKPNPKARLRLFCFPYAGSGANIFYKWPSSLPETVELCLVHLPGRERRQNESPFQSMSTLVQALERPFLLHMDRPAAFFGHSMGGLVSFEFSRLLRQRYGWEPSQLFISGCRAPQSVQSLSRIHTLPTPDFLGKLRLLNGSNVPMPSDPWFANNALRTLRADVAVCETYCYNSEAPLDCPLAVYGGFEDRNVRYDQLEAWRSETTGRFALHLFQGDHFFIHASEELVLKTLSEELNNLASKLG